MKAPLSQEEWEKSVEWIGIVAGCVFKKDDKYLLVQEKQPKVYGLWNVPAGYVDKGEEIVDAAVREAKEESGYDVELDELIDIYHDTTKEPVKHIYRAHIVGGALKIQEDEILDVKWLTYDEIKSLNGEHKLRARFIFDAISKVEGV
jgi:ADP-ribose pyrophosphatase YjhB (NUDIX family)